MLIMPSWGIYVHCTLYCSFKFSGHPIWEFLQFFFAKWFSLPNFVWKIIFICYTCFRNTPNANIFPKYFQNQCDQQVLSYSNFYHENCYYLFFDKKNSCFCLTISRNFNFHLDTYYVSLLEDHSLFSFII